MQPSATASIPPANADMDMQTVQSMDWLFKKERFYLLVQFWQQRATLAEKEVTTLKEQIANNTTNNCDNKDGITMDRTNLETEIAAKDKEINQLLEEVQKLQTTITKVKETTFAQINKLEEQLEHKRMHISRLEAKLDLQRDYDELKRQLSGLRPEPSNSESKSIDYLLEKSKDRPKTPTIKQEPEGVAPLMLLAPPSPAATPVARPPPSPLSPAPPQLPRPFQNVEQFGSMLGEEIVANWRRRRTIELSNRMRLITHSPPDAAAHSPLERTATPEAAGSPPPGEALPAAQPAMHNGQPKSPEDNNNHHLSNNNIPMAATAATTMCGVGFFRGGGDDSLKSPYRPFEEHRSPFRFADELGMAPGSMVGRLGESLIPKGDPMEARLQEMLRYNMDKYASQNLDTLHISRRVRELLSVHNIGQRLFAKYILGLSQGTVSELLSKPKPWDKLTEKGRDSYRKMHAWACDEQAILLLKSLIPKKGKDPGMPPFNHPPRPDTADLTDERLAHIIHEANHFQHLKPSSNHHHHQHHIEDSRSNDDDSKSPSNLCPSPFSKDNSQNRRLKKYENDDIPHDQVERIYKEQLAKLTGRNPRDIFPGGQLDRSDEIRLLIDAYHREILKLNQTNTGGMANLGLLALQQQMSQLPNGIVQDLSLPKDKKLNGDDASKDDDLRHSAFSLVRPKLEPGSQPSGGSTASSPLGNTILPPAMTPSDDFGAGAVASPLQRMASITNSLISQPPSQPHHNSPQRPLKAVLPPITQQQFDQYNNLNTEDIVKKVKEQLSQYSISQRLFGESVLGLSQGSVSDLLARPKPWHMLTQKGREPFIRMKMFLEDDNAVHKLVASQYKIAPEKLMRTGGYGGAVIGKPMPPTQKMLSEAAGLITKMQQEREMMQPMLLTPPGVPPHHAISLGGGGGGGEGVKSKVVSPVAAVQHSPVQQHQSLRGMHQHMSPSVYEMAALTQDLDTQVITTKIKEALLANNIGQKIFGEAVLGLSQGSVSELLSKPKPWHMLSIKGREPFIRMQLWLNDAHNIDRLQALKNERREANKRRRSSGPGGGAHDNSSDTSSNDTSEFYHPHSPSGPAKKQRVLFSEEQKEALRLAFALDPYPNVATIEFLAGELSLSSRTITNWFHNHRMRLKQQVPHGVPNDVPPRDAAGPFDPAHFRLLLNQRLLDLSKERIGLPGVPLPYPPYLAAAPSLAALIGRGLVPSEADLRALNDAVKEQISGLDLSMGLKRDPYDGDDAESNASDESNLSGASLTKAAEPKASPSRSSRRKPAAPQWVNPDWQEPDKEKARPAADDEVIINGVCVMQTEDYGRRGSEETVRVEPTPVLDRFEAASDGSASSGEEEGKSEVREEEEEEERKREEDERWDY